MSFCADLFPQKLILKNFGEKILSKVEPKYVLFSVKGSESENFIFARVNPRVSSKSKKTIF